MNALDHALTWSQWLHAQHAMWWLVGAIIVLLLLSAARNAHRRHDARQSHGSSRWATRREAKRAGLVRKYGYPIGKLGWWILRVVNRHILLVGGTGSGKDRRTQLSLHRNVSLEHGHCRCEK